MAIRVRTVLLPAFPAVEDGGVYPPVPMLLAGEKTIVSLFADGPVNVGGPDLTGDNRYWFPSYGTINPEYGKIYNGVLISSFGVSPSKFQLDRGDFLYGLAPIGGNPTAGPTKVLVFEQI